MLYSRSEDKKKALGIYNEREKYKREHVATNWQDFLDDPLKLCSTCGRQK
jgi:hypothetical protein